MKSSDVLKKLDTLVPNPKCPLNYEKDYELLLAVMLSAQTTDERVNSVTKELFKYNLDELSSIDVKKIEEIIRPVGLSKRKSEYIQKIARVLLEKCSGHVPNDRDFIESLPGIGHKTANVFLSEIYAVPSLAVDTHVTRVSKILGLASPNDDVIAIEDKLCTFFPKKYWSRVHVQLVLFGRYTCKAKKPNCDSCPFKNIECKNPRN